MHERSKLDGPNKNARAIAENQPGCRDALTEASSHGQLHQFRCRYRALPCGIVAIVPTHFVDGGVPARLPSQFVISKRDTRRTTEEVSPILFVHSRVLTPSRWSR